MKTTLMIAGLLTGMIATGAQAQVENALSLSARGILSADFATLDTDRNGLIKMDDMEVMTAERVGLLDMDDDGALSLEEMQRSANADRNGRIEKTFPEIDANGDGLLTVAEIVDYRPIGERLLSRLDTDGDGGVNVTEFEAGQAAQGASN